MRATEPQLLGAGYSVYVRVTRLALIEKGVAFDPVEVDIFDAHANDAAYLKLHPFGRIPTLRHGDFVLYETAAITRYVDEAFPGPALQPTDTQARARMVQMIGIMDSYLYRPLVWGLHVALDDAAKAGRPADAAGLAKAMMKARQALRALDDLASDGPWLLGESLSLADLHLLPMLAYGRVTAEGRVLLSEQKKLQTWWKLMQARPSVVATRFAAEAP
ncbi:glutathione S-transferase family protein [Dongia sp.]|uniref:glutathione S-transferase family protein n=1 Tax=Dongia sp. TaxID=1977262 RepID=UPI0035AFFFC8